MPIAADLVPLFAAIALLAAAAALDVAFRAIPNWLPAALAADGVVLRLFSHQVLPGLAAGSAVFALCLLLWRRGLMGGGDVKLLGAGALVVPTQFAASFVLCVAGAGGLLALAYLLLSRIVAPPGPRRPHALIPRIWRVERRRIRQCRSLPYACAIAAGVLLTLAGG